MLPPAEPVRLALPAPDPPPPRGSIPVVATIAPVVMSVGIWAVTGSVYSLLFAGLGPVVALAGLIDARRQRRRRRREEHARLAGAVARLVAQVSAAHEAERERRAALCAPEGPELARWALRRWASGDPAADAVIRIGRGVAPSPVLLEGDDPGAEPPAEVAAAWDRLRAEADGVPDAALLADAHDGVGFVGPLSLAAAAARSAVVQLAAALGPGIAASAPAAESWTSALPHPVEPGDEGCVRFATEPRPVLVAWARDERDLPPGCTTVVRLDAGTRVPALTRHEARERAQLLAGAAGRHGVAAEGALPDRVVLEEVLAEAPAPRPGSLAAVVGRDGRGPVIVDLVGDGPHALVGGTTGSGKSELLVSWVLAMAHGRSPAEVTFLLVDFKGGAAFAPLAGLPHVVGILSDLDARLTRRAIESLRAELVRRERLLAEAGARAIAELPEGALARLVVVVDEFAAVVAGQPELHEVFADLAARGRSLGLHLVLCTQRPAGVVRDGVLANVTLRVGLRMTDRGDAIALLGDEAAARLPADPRGRAVLGVDGAARPFQVALATADDVERQRATRVPTSGGATGRPWLDPLPTVLPRSAIGAADDGAIPFGVVDLPSEQRQPVAIHRPAQHGHLLVLGATGSGRTTALRVLAAAPGALVLPPDPADAWQALDGLLHDGLLHDGEPAGRRTLLVADDLDLLLGRVPPDERHEFGDLFARVLREGPGRGIGAVASAQRIGGALQPIASLFGSRLVLRMASREEHVLTGGAGSEHDPAAPPGAGRWRGAVVQVAWPGEGALPAPSVPGLPIAAPPAGRPLAIIAARPAALLDLLRAAGRRVAVLAGEPGEPAAPADAEVLLGDPDAWQAEWALLARARRELPIAFVGCTPAELRALARARDPIPPLGGGPGECWLVDGGIVRRARLDGAA